MKKIISAVICICLLCAVFAGCGKKIDDELYKVYGHFEEGTDVIEVDGEKIKVVARHQGLAYAYMGTSNELVTPFKYTINNKELTFYESVKYIYKYLDEVPDEIKYTDGATKYTTIGNTLILNNNNELTYYSSDSSLPEEFTPLSENEMLETAKKAFMSINGLTSIDEFEISTISSTQKSNGQTYPAYNYSFNSKIHGVKMSVADISINSAGIICTINNNYSIYKIYQEIITEKDIKTAQHILNDCIRQKSAHNKDPNTYEVWILEGSVGMPILAYYSENNNKHRINIIPTKLNNPI